MRQTTQHQIQTSQPVPVLRDRFTRFPVWLRVTTLLLICLGIWGWDGIYVFIVAAIALSPLVFNDYNFDERYRQEILEKVMAERATTAGVNAPPAPSGAPDPRETA
ncbi:MAG: hypothetical protein L0220_01105 [Acidobacteria bacterium]|nr:hypothetical protein [Acidobacteriota bacterium]